jgi:hypothetical protein
MKSFLPLACALLVACAPALGAENPSPPANVALMADTPLTTAEGNSFVAPAGWSVRHGGCRSDPDRTRRRLADRHRRCRGQRPRRRGGGGWAAYDAKANWPLKLASDRPSRDGWLQIRGYQYETSANDKRSVSARALKRAMDGP